jgi:hypothetical protein
MRQKNTGNILPIYPIVADTSDEKYEQPIHHVVGGMMSFLPFQIILPTNTTYEFLIFHTSGLQIADITPLVTIQPFANTLGAYTFQPTVNILGLINCQRYQLVIRDVGGDDMYKSDWVLVKSLWDYRLFFTNGSDISNVFYQQAYTQIVYFDGYEDVPLTDITTKAELTLTGKEIITSSRQVEKRVIVGHNFLDSQLSALTRIEMHSTITLFEKNETMGVGISRIVIKHTQTPDDLHDVQFIFDSDIASQTGCGENTFVI